MKLVRDVAPGHEQPGPIADPGAIRSLAGIVPDVTPGAIAAGPMDRLAVQRQPVRAWGAVA